MFLKNVDLLCGVFFSKKNKSTTVRWKCICGKILDERNVLADYTDVVLLRFPVIQHSLAGNSNSRCISTNKATEMFLKYPQVW